MRILFRYRSDMYESKMNYKNNKKYKEENYLCDSCEVSTDESTHVLYCPAYKDLREGKSLDNDEHLASYLLKVLTIRSKLRLSR